LLRCGPDPGLFRFDPVQGQDAEALKAFTGRDPFTIENSSFYIWSGATFPHEKVSKAYFEQGVLHPAKRGLILT
jgi:hypothetical protein